MRDTLSLTHRVRVPLDLKIDGVAETEALVAPLVDEFRIELLGAIDVPRDVELCRRAMDAMSIDVQVVFPTSLLSLGMSPMPFGETQVAYAYNRWMIEEFCSQDERLKFLPYLPLNDPDMCVRMIREFAGNPSV